jgi:hypothetical protein
LFVCLLLSFLSYFTGARLFLDHRRQFFARGTSIFALTHRGGVPAKAFDKFDSSTERLVVPKLSLDEFNLVISGVGLLFCSMLLTGLSQNIRKLDRHQKGFVRRIVVICTHGQVATPASSKLSQTFFDKLERVLHCWSASGCHRAERLRGGVDLLVGFKKFLLLFSHHFCVLEGLTCPLRQV